MALDYRSEYQRYRRYYMYLGPIIKSPVFRAYFSIVLSIFTIAVFTAFAIRPTIATIVSLQKQIEEKQDLNRRLDEKLNALTQLQSDYQAVEPDLPKVFAALPENPAAPQAVILIEKTAVASGVSFTGLSIAKADYTEQASVSGANIASISAQTIPVAVTIAGGFDQIKNFLEQIVKVPRLFSPQDTALSTTAQGSAGLSGQATVKIYYMP